MRKIIEKFFSISLVKQLFIIIGICFLFITCVIHPYIDTKLDYIVEQQVYKLLSFQQNQLISMVEGIDNWSEINRFNGNRQLDANNATKHMIYYGNTLEILSDLDMGSKFIFHEYFLKEVQTFQNMDEEILYGNSDSLSPVPVYYVIKESPTIDNVYWISFIQDDFSYGLVDNIQGELINVLYLVIVIVAFLVICWITTIMRPLKAFVSFIQSLDNKEIEDFSLSRKDEIGEVAKALLEREQQLKKEKNLQEDLIHNISHDLKTPITIIKSYAESMKDDIYPYGTKESSLDIILENGDRLEKKVKDFLLINRLDYLKNQQQSSEQTDIHLLISSILKEFTPLYPNIEFICDLREASFRGEEEHWRSCIMNILENAVRYTKGIITIVLKSEELIIYNNGEAIDEDLLVDIFKPYKKGENGNFGLGMAIAHRITNMYGYDIEPRNIDEGVQFKIIKNS